MQLPRCVAFEKSRLRAHTTHIFTFLHFINKSFEIGTNPFAVLGDEKDGLDFATDADQAHDAVVVDATEHVDLAVELGLVRLTARHQRLDDDEALGVQAAVVSVRLGEEHVAVESFACR